ncbi:NAC domain-containing protein 104-like isoform X2 [Olea europaea var. sylvestris]|uniref:NAC domain-containing protein 104-like isoform X2 n=1 Tax=Olea europaea var. sylvestris TaxID=158386 RepID=UPI000C1D583F|nr:NAC domain-containing protein 104-like isoform X2 [Olea europaea var. sylvestris]
MEEDRSTLPPGLCFAPTDEELIVYFLYQKAASLPCYPNVIPDLNLYSPHPWELDDKTFASRRQWYFFSRKMQNRTAENGFWKEIGVDETILTSTGNKVGIKKYLVFYDDDVRSENKTNWIMEEYRLLISPKGQNQIQVMVMEMEMSSRILMKCFCPWRMIKKKSIFHIRSINHV